MFVNPVHPFDDNLVSLRKNAKDLARLHALIVSSNHYNQVVFADIHGSFTAGQWLVGDQVSPSTALLLAS